MFAVVKTGGKQYRVKEGDILSIEKLEAEKGQNIDFNQVLLLEDGDNIQVGQPYLDKAIVRAEVIEDYKDKKVIVFKKKRRKGYRRTKGHRQLLTKVKISGIYTDGSGLNAKKSESEGASEIEATPKKAGRKQVEASPEKPAAKKRTRTKKSETAAQEEPLKEK